MGWPLCWPFLFVVIWLAWYVGWRVVIVGCGSWIVGRAEFVDICWLWFVDCGWPLCGIGRFSCCWASYFSKIVKVKIKNLTDFAGSMVRRDWAEKSILGIKGTFRFFISKSASYKKYEKERTIKRTLPFLESIKSVI
ncbi:hypothetical protein TROPICALSUN_87 [Erwinia phage vB_EamM_TropicalSun]|uniref:Transmembrane protein n=1 Tax=Erwinia phage vB_EamM_TropicalSun TaxID=2591372 RepID=A0A5B9NN13_9CAUD|nr:hypothetical protein TROPICALSUN_87 [Erwinia phage vB_EamM_TropicalSun]